MGQNWKNKLRPIKQFYVIYIKRAVPLEFFKIIGEWDGFHKSPYSDTAYSGKKDWGYTPDNTLRFSDHWNFKSQGKIHCITKTKVTNDSHWTLAKFDAKTEKYEVVLSLKRDSSNENYQKIRQIKIDLFKNDEDIQKSIEKGKVLKGLITKKEVFAEIIPVLNGINQAMVKGLVKKYTSSKVRILQNNGEEVFFKNARRDRLKIKMVDLEGETLHDLMMTKDLE